MKSPVGEQELAVLRWVAERGPVSVGQAAEAFAASHGLARSTVLTVMERLRKKGHLTRRKDGGVFQYASRASEPELLRDVVGAFVQRTLRGSLAPVVTFLAESDEVSDAELKQLEDVVARLQARRKGEEP